MKKLRKVRALSKRQLEPHAPPVIDRRAPRNSSLLDVLMHDEAVHQMMDSRGDYAIFMLDSRGCVRSWNNGAQNIKGYSREEILGKDFSVFYSAEDRARVFEPFERGAAAAQTFVPGLGLGLAVVRDLAAAIGARVDLDSAPGAGTTFTIVLPRRQPASARSVTSSWRGASS